MASNLQFISTDKNGKDAEFGYKVEGAYSTEKSGGDLIHKFSYVGQLRAKENFELSGQIQAKAKPNKFLLVSTTKLPKLENLLELELGYETEFNDVQKIQFQLRKFVLPGLINMHDGVAVFIYDDYKNTFQYKSNLFYESTKRTEKLVDF